LTVTIFSSILKIDMKILKKIKYTIVDILGFILFIPTGVSIARHVVEKNKIPID